MTGPAVDMGIAAFGYAFGEETEVAAVAHEYVDNPSRVLHWGYRSFHRAPHDVQATDLAAGAARQALEQADLTPDDIDLLVLAGPDIPEYLAWDGAAALARELKITRTQTLVLHEGCGAGVHGLHYVASTLALQPETRTALFVAVNRTSEFHRNRMNLVNTVLSDAAVAVVIRRGHPANRWLGTEQFTDPEHCDILRVDFGGAASPLPPSGWSSRKAPGGHDRIREQFADRPEKLHRFIEDRYALLAEVIDAACARAGIGREDLAHLIYLNDSAASIAAIAEPLGIPLERTNAELAPDHGHMGAADQLLSLGLQLERGEVRSGDVVVLCGISAGRWGATIFQI
ncbi:3-oxoacyl-ACP synthase III family protein [Streptomyces lusitanus]|uniref:3-oxoacyl-[acyl-carrier-protein] synthase III C-terminal domain-containing protein n=1 Tax=Streptomyces lusitanus TaxID=68232 RepID=A0ABU3JUZ0_9ACTN|nr:3-oxoacyl-[acyl-carrier-protein] synthase III C-terminal domain-containing protein [Streptomyces lusitanus]